MNDHVVNRVGAPAWLIGVRAWLKALEARPLPASIGALLDEAAADVPDRVALSFIASGEDLTYGALRDAVGRTATGLRAAGIRHGTHVAVMLPNIPAMPITWLALARIGAVMVPVNIRYTGTELDYVLTNSEASALVIHADYLPVVDASAVARSLTGRDDLDTLRQIVAYVGKTLTYAKDDPADVGALAVLRKKQGVCSGFADLFVALCRAKGIPARCCT